MDAIIALIINMITGRGGRISSAQTSHAGDREFGSRSSQTDDLNIYTCHFLVWRLALIGKSKDWLAQCQDNGTECNIMSWCQWPGLPVRLYYKVTISLHCHKSVSILI